MYGSKPCGHPDNERCDQLAVTASMGPDLAVDEVYEHLMLKRNLLTTLNIYL